MNGEGIQEKVTEGSEGASPTEVWGKCMPGRGNSEHRGAPGGGGNVWHVWAKRTVELAAVNRMTSGDTTERVWGGVTSCPNQTRWARADREKLFWNIRE